MSGMAGLLRIAGAAVVTALVMAACAPRPEPDADPDSEPDDASEGDVSPGQASPAETEISPGVTLSLAMAPGDPAAGEPLEFTLTVRNDTADEVVLDFPDGQRFDFEATSGGESVWRWAEDMFFPQVLGRERIGAGDAMPWTTTLEDGLPAGDYTLRGTLTTRPPHEVEIGFRVDGEGGAP